MIKLNEFKIKLENKAKKIENDAKIMMAKAETFYEILDLMREETPQIQKEEFPQIQKTEPPPEIPLSPYRKPMPYTPSERFETQRTGDHHHKPWTKPDIEYLISLVERGLDDHKISDLMGRGFQAICKKRIDLGMKKERGGARVGFIWDKTETDMLKGMYLNGFSAKQIATRLRKTKSVVSNKIYKLKQKGEL